MSDANTISANFDQGWGHHGGGQFGNGQQGYGQNEGYGQNGGGGQGDGQHGEGHGWGHGGFGGFGGLSFQTLENFVGMAANTALTAYGVSVTITHTGGIGVDLGYKGHTVDLTGFSLDVKAGTIDAKVVADGHSLGNVALLQLGADGTVGLTAITAKAIDAVLGSNVVSASTVFDLGKILSGLGEHGHCGEHGHGHNSGGGKTISGGETLAVLPGAQLLQAHGVSVTALGDAHFFSFAKGSALLLPISGGQETATGNITDHNGGGLELAAKGKTVDLMNFVFDVKDEIVQADVTLGGKDLGVQTVLDIAKNGALSLTSATASLIDAAFGQNLVSAGTVIGGGYSVALTGHGCHHGDGLDLLGAGGGHWSGGHGHHG